MGRNEPGGDDAAIAIRQGAFTRRHPSPNNAGIATAIIGGAPGLPPPGLGFSSPARRADRRRGSPTGSTPNNGCWHLEGWTRPRSGPSCRRVPAVPP